MSVVTVIHILDLVFFQSLLNPSYLKEARQVEKEIKKEPMTERRDRCLHLVRTDNLLLPHISILHQFAVFQTKQTHHSINIDMTDMIESDRALVHPRGRNTAGRKGKMARKKTEGAGFV